MEWVCGFVFFTFEKLRNNNMINRALEFDLQTLSSLVLDVINFPKNECDKQVINGNLIENI